MRFRLLSAVLLLLSPWARDPRTRAQLKQLAREISALERVRRGRKAP
jgi:hypothetical protein